MKSKIFSSSIISYLIWYFVGIITVLLISTIVPLIPFFVTNIFLFIPVDLILLWELVRVPVEKKQDALFMKYKNAFILWSSLLYVLVYFVLDLDHLHLILDIIAHIILAIVIILPKFAVIESTIQKNIQEYFNESKK